MGSYNTVSERQLAMSALKMNPEDDLRVLVGGLGLGYTVHTVLSSERVSYVEVVEFLPPVIDWLKRGLFPLAEELKSDSRLFLVVGDIFARLANPPEQKFNLILIDVDHAPEENLGKTNSSFYTEDGLLLAKKHLAPNGVLAVWSYAESFSFATALRRTFSEVRVEPVTFENKLVEEEQTDWLFLAWERRLREKK